MTYPVEFASSWLEGARTHPRPAGRRNLSGFLDAFKAVFAAWQAANRPSLTQREDFA
jgi:hypothetical protein